MAMELDPQQVDQVIETAHRDVDDLLDQALAMAAAGRLPEIRVGVTVGLHGGTPSSKYGSGSWSATRLQTDYLDAIDDEEAAEGDEDSVPA